MPKTGRSLIGTLTGFKSDGGRLRVGIRTPLPAIARVLTHSGVAEADKGRLQLMLGRADSVMLFAGICAAQEELGRRVDRHSLNARPEDPVAVDLQRFIVSLPGRLERNGRHIGGHVGGRSLTRKAPDPSVP